MTTEIAMYILIVAAKLWLFMEAQNTITSVFLRHWFDQGSPKAFLKYFGTTLVISWTMIFFLF